ncbi:MAG: hypothetical protein MR724_09760 [Prevotella sp.]|nr:hypothetical protein [Prevotella sp.]
MPRLRALHPQVPVQRQTSQEKANDNSTGTTATFKACNAASKASDFEAEANYRFKAYRYNRRTWLC